MKKIFIAVLAVAALASCSKEQVVVEQPKAAIGFDTFVENSTRANDLTVGNFDFGVYGLVEKGTQSSLIFNNQTVAANGTYSPAQYWIASAQYYFTAIAPKTNANWTYTTTNAHTGTIAFDNSAAAANQDLLFAYNKPAATPAQITAAPATVGFTFNHMLSRVRFTFTNGFGEGSNIKLQVTDVTITDAYATGELDVVGGTPAEWDNFGATFSKNFGQVGGKTLATLVDAVTVAGETVSASTEHFYLIPATKAYNVTFTVKLFQAGVELDTYARTATIPATAMAKGMSYDIKTTLNAQNTSDDGQLYPIEFTVTGVEEWEDYTNVNGTVNQPTTGNN